MRVHRGPSCSPREPRTVCPYKQDLTCAVGAHERNREAPACAGKNSATLRPTASEGWKLRTQRRVRHTVARAGPKRSTLVSSRPKRASRPRAQLSANRRAPAEDPSAPPGRSPPPLGRDDALDVLPVGAPHVQRVRHPERAAVPGEVRPGPVQPDERIRQLHESSRPAHRTHHGDAVHARCVRPSSSTAQRSFVSSEITRRLRREPLPPVLPRPLPPVSPRAVPLVVLNILVIFVKMVFG